MAKFEEINNLYQETAAKVVTGPEEWLKFVGTASNLYRYPFEDQLIIYAQRPDAKQCAPMDYWNKNLRCYVNKGAKGIALLDRQARGNKLRYVFDMSDVHKVSDRSIMPYQWELPDGAKDSVAHIIESKYMGVGKLNEGMDFEDRIIQIADQIAADVLPDFEENILGKLENSALSEIYEESRGEILQDALSASIASMVLTRCGVDPKECEDRLTGLQYIGMFDTMDTLNELGTMTSSLAKPVLIDIEKEVGHYERINRIENTVEAGYNKEKANEERGDDNGNRVRTERGLSDTQTESERSTGGDRGDREVRTSSGEVSERVQAGDLRNIPNDGGLVGTSDNDRPTGERAQGSDYQADDESRGSEPANAGGELRSVSSESADDRTGSGENDLGGNDLYLEPEQEKRIVILTNKPIEREADPKRVYITVPDDQPFSQYMNAARRMSPDEIHVDSFLASTVPDYTRLREENEKIGIPTKTRIIVTDINNTVDISVEEPKYEQLSLFPTETEQIESIEAAENEVTAAFSVDEIEKAVNEHSTIRLSVPEYLKYEDQPVPIRNARAEEFKNMRIAFDEESNSMLLLADTEHDSGLWLRDFGNVYFSSELVAQQISDYLAEHQMQISSIEPEQEHDIEQSQEKEFEKRLYRDDNGFYNVQIRQVPVEDWQQNDGWGTVFVTEIYDNAMDRLSKEPGIDVTENLHSLAEPMQDKELSTDEKYLADMDISYLAQRFAKSALAYDELDSLGFAFNGWQGEQHPMFTEQFLFGKGLHGDELINLAYRFRDGFAEGTDEEFRFNRDLALGVMGEKGIFNADGVSSPDLTYEFRDGNFIISAGDISREVSFQMVSNAILSMAKEEYERNIEPEKRLEDTRDARYVGLDSFDLVANDIQNIHYVGSEYSNFGHTAEHELTADIEGKTQTLHYEVNYGDGDDENFSIHTDENDIYDRMPEPELRKLEVKLNDEVRVGRYAQQIEKAETAEELKNIQYSFMDDENFPTRLAGRFWEAYNAAEQKFVEPEQGIFRIYQMKDGEEYRYAHFENMETLEKERIRLNHEDYNLVYEGDLADIPGATDQEKLEHIFEKFGNSPFEERPADFKGYSISVSDVITFDKGNGEEPHFVDSFGFKDFPAFLQEKEAVKEIQNEEVPLPNVKVEWSESPLFESGKTYSIAEYDSIMHEADLSRHAKQQELIEKHGSWQAWYDSNDQPDFLSYEKVKVTVNFKDGTSQTERQDIGDGIGGLLEFLSHYDKYKDYMSELREAAGREEDKTPFHEVIGAEFKERYNARSEEKTAQENAPGERNPYELLSLAIGDHLVDDKGVLWTVTNNGNFLLSIEKAEENRVDTLMSARSFTNWQNRVKETGNIDDFEHYRKITVEEYLAEQGSQEIPGKSAFDTAKLEEQIDVLKDENVGIRSLLGRDDVSASEKAEYRSKLTANLNEIERLGGIISNERIRASEQSEELETAEENQVPKENYVRFGTIPETEKSLNYLKLNAEQRQDVMDQIENGNSPENAVEYLKENLNSWKNVDSTEIFEGGISVFKADSNGLPVIENLQQAISLSVRLDDPVYLVSGDVVGTGQDGEPLLVNVSGKEVEISRSQLQDIIVASLSNGFAAQKGTKDINTDDLNIHRFAGENGDIVTFMGIEFSEPVSKEWGNSVDSDADIQQVQPEKVSGNFHITDYDLGKGGAKEKFRRNVEAIKTLRKIEDEDRAATPEEQQILSHYIGWGGLADAFDERKPNWSKEFNELKELLTPEEYAVARSTTRDAFYTSPEVIEGIYGALDRMGFENGNILEPSMGVGNFFGMLPKKMQDSKLYGVELDSISGRIAKKLYPDANIQITGYQDTGFDNNSFDVAVGNVPFDNYVPFDKDYSKQRFMLHDYFFAKTLDKVRPGGVIAFVTSKGTLDKEDPKVRKYIAQRAEFLGAVRLPGGKDGAFKDNAGTEVTSDIIFLQKRDGIVDVDPDWVHLGMDENGIAMNQYFVDHPEQIVGHMALVSGRFGMETACLADTEKPFKEQYNAALSGISGKYTAIERSPLKTEEQEETLLPSPEDKNFSFVVRNDKVYYRENAALVPQKLKGDKEDRIKGMVEIRDLTQNLLDMQLNDASDDEVAAAQEKLNNAYDSFVKEHGRIDSDKNKRAFSEDNSYNLIRALEKYDDNGEFKGKADIFTKRTIQRAVPVTSVETASEALSVCLNEKSAVDIEFMSKLCHKPGNEVIEDLQGIIFKNPLTDRFETSDEYLSGNVRNKLAVARSYAEQNPEFAVNVAALESVQPKELSAGDIDVRLGATWIDPKYIKDFMKEVLDTSWYDLKYGTIDCKFSDTTAKWWIEGKTKDKRNVKVNDVFGTPRMNAYEILEDTLNLKTCEVHDTYIDDDGKKKTKVNKDATIVAQQKQDALKEAFQSWIFADPERRETLVKQYNEIFNSTRPREFNGDYITLPGSNPNITLKKHQKDSVARIISGENTLLAHCVGAGKTFTMVAGAMESKRLGLCKKSMFVVPNHLTEQWGSEFRTLYPNANILVATKKDFEPANRKKFISRIATGNYDAVIIGHTQFLKIPVSKEREAAFIQSEIDDALAAREALDEREDRHTIKDVEGFIKRKQAKLEEKLNSPKRDDVVTFEQLGIDRLFVDESHNFKNLEMTTKMSRIAGVQTSDAEKSNDLLLKCRYLDEITDGKGVTFATGTPISNSMTELYTNMRYLQMAKLKELGLNHFDKWASTFGETVTAMEVSPEGQNYRAKTRFAKFFNLPELMSIFKEAADVRTSDMLNLPIPEAEYVDVVLEKSPEQEAILESIGERAEKIRGGSVDSSVDNMLKITNDGRKMALDQRLYSDVLPDNPNSKAEACAENIAQIYRDTMQEKSTQLVFCDLGTPSSKGDDGKFNVYDDIKQKLMAKGIPENEIAFIHDCDKGSNPDKKKDELFAKVRSGKVRVLIGSTPKLGAGTNIQDRLIALHHMDVPWRPADLEQQEGRILRQGNQNPKVKIFRYITKGTFDTYNWQTIEKKQTFIGQIMTSKSPVRSHDDVDDAALKYAEVKALASDNPLIAEKMTLEVDVQKLRVAKAAHTNQIYAMQDNITIHYPAQIANDKELIKAYKEDIAIHNAHKPADKDSFSIIVGNRSFEDKKEGAEVLQAVIRNNARFMGDFEKIGSYRGFDVCMRFDLMAKKFDLKLVGETAHYVNDVGHDAFGTITKINNVLDNMPQALERITQRLENTEKQLETAKEEVTKPFPKEAELTEKLQRLSEVDALLKMDEKDAPIIAGDEEKSVETEPCKSKNEEVVEAEQKEEQAAKQEVFAVAYKDGAGKANMAYVECDSKESAENHIRVSVPNSAVLRALPFKKEAVPAGKEVINLVKEAEKAKVNMPKKKHDLDR